MPTCKRSTRLQHTALSWATAALVVASVLPAAAADGTLPLPCKFCAFESGYSGEIEAGLGYLANDAYAFGDYSGLSDQGLFAIAEASLRWREDEGAAYWDLDVRNLGLDARRLDARGGEQGRYRVTLGYDNIPRRINDSARTPFSGSGGPALTLPSGWTTGASTQGMPDLTASLRPLALEQDRERYRLGFELSPAAHWNTALMLRRDVRDGIRAAGGSFITLDSLLPQPVDSVTDQVDLSTSFTGAGWQAAAGYYASFFRNDHRALSWQNPYNPLGGADAGRMALAPDNQFHQLSLSGGYQPLPRVRLSAHLAGGRMFQDEPYLAATINPDLVVALPRTSLDGQVDTLAARLRASLGPWSGLRFSLAYAYDDRDNRTPQAIYTPVITDVYLGEARANLPYDFTRQTVKLGADYRLAGWARLQLGWDQDWRSRSYQARHDTDEWTLRSRVRLQPPLPLSVALGYVHADRSGSAWLPASPGTPADNPRLRPYHLADRVRDAATLNLGSSPLDWLGIDVNASYGRDRYSGTDIGLDRRRSYGYGADLWLRPREALAITAFWSVDDLDSRQAGSQSFGLSDWTADNRDRASVAGLRIEQAELWARCDVGASYEYVRTRGETVVATGAADPPFPDLSSKRQETRVYALYRLRPRLGIRVEYRYADYRSADWALADVAPDTVHNLLALGQSSPVFHANLFGVSARYEFE